MIQFYINFNRNPKRSVQSLAPFFPTVWRCVFQGGGTKLRLSAFGCSKTNPHAIRWRGVQHGVDLLEQLLSSRIQTNLRDLPFAVTFCMFIEQACSI